MPFRDGKPPTVTSFIKIVFYVDRIGKPSISITTFQCFNTVVSTGTGTPRSTDIGGSYSDWQKYPVCEIDRKTRSETLNDERRGNPIILLINPWNSPVTSSFVHGPPSHRRERPTLARVRKSAGRV